MCTTYLKQTLLPIDGIFVKPLYAPKEIEEKARF